MSLQAHLDELASKHRALDEAIEKEMAHPSVSDEEIAEMKREKLRLKDEIVRLESQLDAA